MYKMLRNAVSVAIYTTVAGLAYAGHAQAVSRPAVLSAPVSTDKSGEAAMASRLIDDTDQGWSWSDMTTMEDPGFTGGTAHTGGPGASGDITFTGTSIEIYVMRGSDVTVGDRTHKVGRLKVSIDGVPNQPISLTHPGTVYNYCAFSQTGLSAGKHDLRVEADAGWIVIDYIRANGGPEPPDSGSETSTQQGQESSDHSAGLPGQIFNSKAMELTSKDFVDGRSAGITGFEPNIGPELEIGSLPFDWGYRPIYAHSGDKAIRYSGSSSGVGNEYCYMLAFNVDIPVSYNTNMAYWILPQQDNGRYVAVDLHCTDGSVLSRLGAVDMGSIPMSPMAGHGGNIPLYTWTPIQCKIGKWLAGKTIDKIWIGFARNGGGGQYRGYIDDLSIYNSN